MSSGLFNILQDFLARPRLTLHPMYHSDLMEAGLCHLHFVPCMDGVTALLFQVCEHKAAYGQTPRKG